MNLESINKWLDEEYGVAYTDLKELHNSLKDENMILQDRIDKAIEYIKEHQRKDEFLNLNEWQTRDLLNILKGSDNNE